MCVCVWLGNQVISILKKKVLPFAHKNTLQVLQFLYLFFFFFFFFFSLLLTNRRFELVLKFLKDFQTTIFDLPRKI